MYRLDRLIALEVASDRRDDIFSLEFPDPWEAREARRAAERAAERSSLARRALAQGLAAVSRGSAAAVRQLDDAVADDLGRALAAAK